METNLFSVNNFPIVITGGLGQLGQEFSKALCQAGAKVVLLDINANPKRLSPELKTAYDNHQLLVIESDVTDLNRLEQAAEEIEQKFGSVYGLINNAAIDTPPNASIEENGAFEDYSVETFDKVMTVNVLGVMQASQIFGKRMVKAGRGSIINISSIYGMVSPNQDIYEHIRSEKGRFYKPIAYSTSKSALFNLTRYLATYWASKNIRVNTLTFGGVFCGQDERFVEAYKQRVPMHRMANKEEYNGAIIFLLSQASSYMTGANLVMDGGWTAW